MAEQKPLPFTEADVRLMLKLAIRFNPKYATLTRPALLAKLNITKSDGGYSWSPR